MSIRGFSPIIGLQHKNKLTIQTRNYRSGRTHSEKKFTPKINKSFTCYNEASPSQSDKSKFVSFLNTKPRIRSHSKFRMKSSQKINQNMKKDQSSLLVDRAEYLLTEGKQEEAFEIINKVLKDDPSCPSALLLRGKTYMKIQSFKEAANDFSALTEAFPLYEKSVYVYSAMCFVAIGDYSSALKKLTKALARYPKYKEALLARGQLFNYQKLWEKAASDFYKVINSYPEDGSAYIGIVESLIGMNEHEKALKILKTAKKCKNFISQILLKKGKLQFELGLTEKAVKTFNKALKISPSDAETYYYKALVFLKTEDLAEAALCLEQVVKFDIEKKFIGPAIFDLGAIKVKLKDFYGAMHTFQRAVDMKVSIKPQKVLENYVETVITLMKRKFKEGTILLTKIIKKNNPVISDYIGNCYTFRGYALAAQDLHEKAVADLTKASKLQTLDSASEYNLFVSSAVLLSEKRIDQSLALIRKAKELYPKNPEPFLYEAFIHFSIQNYSKSVSCLTAALALKPGDCDIHFFRSIVSYEAGDSSEAIQDLDISIDKSEENNAFHYLCRGLNYTSLSMYSEALNDFSAVVQIDSSFWKGHLFKGKCAFLLDDINLAYSEFQKMVALKPEDPEVHLYVGDLLLLNHSVKDALKAYKNSLSKGKTKAALLQCAKCYLVLGDVKKASEEIAEALVFESSKNLLQDFNVLKTIEQFSNGGFKEALKFFSEVKRDGVIVSVKEVKKLMGLCWFYLGEYRAALGLFKEIKEKNNFDQDDISFNMAICYIFLEKLDLAISLLNELAYLYSGEDRMNILFLIGYIYNGKGDRESAEEFWKTSKKISADLLTNYHSEAQTVVLPLSSDSSFSSKFQLVSLKVNSNKEIFVRPSLRLPSFELPVFDFPIEKIVTDQFSIKSIKCKPEAPWLNRVQGMIQFTDEVQDLLGESLTESVEEKQEENVFEGLDNFKKYRSALCLPVKESDKLFQSIKAVLEQN